jgi:hypothetical protein
MLPSAKPLTIVSAFVQFCIKGKTTGSVIYGSERQSDWLKVMVGCASPTFPEAMQR